MLYKVVLTFVYIKARVPLIKTKKVNMLRANCYTESSNLPLVCEDDSSLLIAFHALYSSITIKKIYSLLMSYICSRQRTSTMPVLCTGKLGTSTVCICKYKVAMYTYQIGTRVWTWVSQGNLGLPHPTSITPFLFSQNSFLTFTTGWPPTLMFCHILPQIPVATTA